MKARLLGSGLALFLTGGSLSATSITAATPHDPTKARQSIAELLAQIDDSDFGALRRKHELSIYSDKFGRVEGDEELRAFLADKNSSEGRPDAGRYEIYRIHPIVKDKYQPTYVIYVDRDRWFSESVDPFTGEDVPAGYHKDGMTWLATFSSNTITHFREAEELYKLGIHGVKRG